MKILYATRAAIPYPSAASLNTVQMCESLTRLGHDVTLAIGRKFWRRPRGSWTAHYGFEPTFCVERGWEIPKTSWLFDRWVTRRAKLHNAVIYLRYPRLLAQLRCGQRAILELHSGIQPAEVTLIAQHLAAGTLAGVVVITQALSNHLARMPELASHVEKFFVAPDAVDARRFPRSHDGTPPDRVGYVGSLYPGKGMERISALADQLPSTRFDVYGGTPSLVAQWRHKTSERRNLAIHGRISPADVPNRMSEFGIALLPNQPSIRLPNGDDIGEFTSPMKLFEYMASGRAIVASDLPGLREILRHEENCLLVPHGDNHAWADAIQRLQGDATLRHEIAGNARNEAIQKYTFEQRFQRILTRFGSRLSNTYHQPSMVVPSLTT